MVQHALEDRDLSQNPEVWLQERGTPKGREILQLRMQKTAIRLVKLAKVKDRQRPQTKSISTYLIRIARLGGYLARAGDAAPGNAVIWRGLSRLTDIELGFTLGAKLVGN